MKEITLPKGYVAIVDDEDYERLKEYNWTLYFGSKTVYATRYPSIAMHREILRVTDSKLHIDHIDRDGLNNRKENLRIVNCAQNQWNAGLHARNTTGYRGVSKKTGRDRYCVDIQVNGKGYCAGYYATKEEAAIAFNMAAIKHYGEYAFLNEVDMDIVLGRNTIYQVNDCVKYVFKTDMELSMKMGCIGRVIAVNDDGTYIVRFRNYEERMRGFQLELVNSTASIKMTKPLAV